MKLDLMEEANERTSRHQIRLHADRLLLRNEFAVAYQEPIEADPERGYLTAWVRLGDRHAPKPLYERHQALSGDNHMVQRWFSEMAQSDHTVRIERFTNRHHNE
jgi:hypothetical protein